MSDIRLASDFILTPKNQEAKEQEARQASVTPEKYAREYYPRFGRKFKTKM